MAEPLIDPKAIGEQVLKARKAKGLTQEAVAHQAGVSQRTVSAIEKGTMEPALKTLLAVLAVVGLMLLVTSTTNRAGKGGITE